MVFISWTHSNVCSASTLQVKQLPWVTWKKLAQLLRCRFSKLLNLYTSRMDHNTQDTPPYEYHLTCEKTYQRGWDPGPANKDIEYGEESLLQQEQLKVTKLKKHFAHWRNDVFTDIWNTQPLDTWIPCVGTLFSCCQKLNNGFIEEI